MTANIYAQHDAAFARVSAYVVMKNGERIATVAIKFPADGAGRLYAYTHYIGAPMTRDHASGYGYDKRTPAVLGAFLKTQFDEATHMDRLAELRDFKAQLNPHAGEDWTRQLERAGFTVLQAV